ncbi:hypothetical protein AYI70_g11676 [Smittium culicis]|uniref:DUF4211 domain-containing protein n=1 Tax=Smittium culicis TaxID=133412 RepID=A0A1R1X0S8_9FUNG|nr:hypothetical protein AYI70_g11676 [Smittium culicis]
MSTSPSFRRTRRSLNRAELEKTPSSTKSNNSSVFVDNTTPNNFDHSAYGSKSAPKNTSNYQSFFGSVHPNVTHTSSQKKKAPNSVPSKKFPSISVDNLTHNSPANNAFVVIENYDKTGYTKIDTPKFNFKNPPIVTVSIDSTPELSSYSIFPQSKYGSRNKKRSSRPSSNQTKSSKPEPIVLTINPTPSPHLKSKISYGSENSKNNTLNPPSNNTYAPITYYSEPPKRFVSVLITKNSLTNKVCRIVSKAISTKLANKDISFSNLFKPTVKNGIINSPDYNNINSSPLRKKSSIRIYESSSEESKSSSPEIPLPIKKGINFQKSEYISSSRNNNSQKNVKIFDSDNDSSEIEDASIYEDKTFLSENKNFGFERKVDHHPNFYEQSQSYSQNTQDNTLNPFNTSFKPDTKIPLNQSNHIHYNSLPNFEPSIKSDLNLNTSTHYSSESENTELPSTFVNNTQTPNNLFVIQSTDDDAKTHSDSSGVIKRKRIINRKNVSNNISPPSVSPKSIVMKYKLQKELNDLKVSRGYAKAQNKKLKRTKKRSKPSFRELLKKTKSDIRGNRTGLKDFNRKYNSFYVSGDSDSFDSQSSSESFSTNDDSSSSTSSIPISSYSDVINFGLSQPKSTSSKKSKPKKSRRSPTINSTHSNTQPSPLISAITRNDESDEYNPENLSNKYDPSSDTEASVSSSGFVVTDEFDDIVESTNNDADFYKAIDNFEISSQQRPSIFDSLIPSSKDREIRLADFGISTNRDFQSSFNTYVQYMTHAIFNEDILACVDPKTASYFESAKNTVENRIETIRDSLVSSSVWNPQFLIDLKSFPIYELEFIDPELGCEACNFGISRTSTFIVNLLAQPVVYNVPVEFLELATNLENFVKDVARFITGYTTIHITYETPEDKVQFAEDLVSQLDEHDDIKKVPISP